MGINTDEQWPVDALLLAVETDSLGDRQNMRLVEGVVQRRAAVSGGSKSHPVRRHGRIGAIDIVGGNQAGDVGQHLGLGWFTGIRGDAHHLPPVAISGATKLEVFPAARRRRESKGRDAG